MDSLLTYQQYRYFAYDPEKDPVKEGRSLAMLLVVNQQNSTYTILGYPGIPAVPRPYVNEYQMGQHLLTLSKRAKEITEDEFTLELLKRGLTFDPTIIR